MPRRFPAPWTVEQIPGGFKVVDANGQSLAYVCASEKQTVTATALTLDEGRRIAANIAKLPGLTTTVRSPTLHASNISAKNASAARAPSCAVKGVIATCSCRLPTGSFE